MAIEGKKNRKEQIDASSPSMAIEGSEININTGKVITFASWAS
ncbi:unnamed protein product [Brassica oleracea]